MIWKKLKEGEDDLEKIFNDILYMKNITLTYHQFYGLRIYMVLILKWFYDDFRNILIFYDILYRNKEYIGLKNLSMVLIKWNFDLVLKVYIIIIY
jgi:hypothetical protein